MTKSTKFFFTLLSASLLLVACQNKEVQPTAKSANSSQTSSSAMAQQQEAATTEHTASSEATDNSSDSQEEASSVVEAEENASQYVTPFPEELLGSWAFLHESGQYQVTLTFTPDGSVVKKVTDLAQNLETYHYSSVESSEILGNGLYRFHNVGGEREVTAGSGLGGHRHFELGVLFNADGTISNQVWSFDLNQDPATFEYPPTIGTTMTRVE